MSDDDMKRKTSVCRRCATSRRTGIELVGFMRRHGYLLHQFLSLSNKRSGDEYGSSLENRMRFPLRFFRAVQSPYPETIRVGVGQGFQPQTG
ncbi:oxidoreductase [Pantoea sp. LMR881]|uniref:oxidoreductase n=1 Tax=Pantoea sp. LMR881 TaxID=3014336 RepID=UPI003FA71E2C